MSDDKVASPDDEPVGESAEVPTSAARPKDDGPADDDDTPPEAPSLDEVADEEKHQDDETTSASDTEQKQSVATPKMHTLPEDPETSAEQLFERHSAMNDRRNKETSPPDGERVTFRSVTLTELYVGPQIDGLATALKAVDWINVDENFVDEIAKARQMDKPYNKEFQLQSSLASAQAIEGTGKTSLPDGIQLILGQLYVLGPSMVTLALTFVLTDAQVGCLDKVLHDYVKAELLRSGSRPIGVKSIYEKKRERVRAVIDEVGTRCVVWLQSWATGTLGVGDGYGLPLCSLIGLAQGKPFERRPNVDPQPPAEYLRLLNFDSSFFADRFDRPDYMFLAPRNSRRSQEYVAAFNEVLAAESYQHASMVPEILHQVIFSFMAGQALDGILRTFESRMRTTRSILASLDFGEAVKLPKCRKKVQRAWVSVARWLQRKPPAESPTEQLRNQLLVLSRDIAVVTGDIKGVIDNIRGVSLWANYPLLVAVEPSLRLPPTRNPARVPQENLTEFIASLKTQETELRELILVTSQAASETQDKKTQNRLNSLTIVLVALTLALVFIGIVQLVDTVPSTSSTPTPPPSASSPAAKPSAHPLLTPSPTTSRNRVGLSH